MPWKGLVLARGRACALLCALLLLPIAACIPTIPGGTEDDSSWTSTRELGIWATKPSDTVPLGLNNKNVPLAWHVSVPEGTTATVSILLTNLDDSNSTVASGIPAVAGVTGTYEFRGVDNAGTQLPIGIYDVEYTIEDGSGGTATDTASGDVMIPLHFTAPTTPVAIQAEDLPTDKFVVRWDFLNLNQLIALSDPNRTGAMRLDIGLISDPNAYDPNNTNDGVHWLSSGGLILWPSEGFSPTDFEFDGTVYETTNFGNKGADPEGQDIEPGTYYVLGRMLHSSFSWEIFYLWSQGTLTVLP